MTDTFLAPAPVQPVLYPLYPVRYCRCTACGEEQPDAGQIPAGEKTGTCMICGQFRALEIVWPVQEKKGEECGRNQHQPKD